ETPGRDKTLERLSCERSLLPTEQRCAGNIRLNDIALSIEGEIPDRGEVVKVHVLVVLRRGLHLRLSQCLILHLQLYVINIEFLDELLDIGGCLTFACGLYGQRIFRPLPEVIKVLICCGFFCRNGSAVISSEKGMALFIANFLFRFSPAGFKMFRPYVKESPLLFKP
ncbi:MAG: hypothetical protein ACXWMI_07600, partial [Syntrophales bacterium]